MRGAMPTDVMRRTMDDRLLRVGLQLFGKLLIPAVPYADNYFLADALAVKQAVRLPLVYIGGAASRAAIDEVLGHGFVAVAMARALIRDPAFINRLAAAEANPGVCDHCNYCAARIYTTTMACHHRQPPEPA
jgi:2,4-dienoyl-CoA reductase-like NADH-dependent reductase (Old Yellow Enzyme family)